MTHYETVQAAITTAGYSSVPLIVDSDSVPSGTSVIWASLGGEITDAPSGRERTVESFQIEVWQPSKATGAVSNYGTATDALMAIARALRNAGASVEIGADNNIDAGITVAAGGARDVIVRVLVATLG